MPSKNTGASDARKRVDSGINDTSEKLSQLISMINGESQSTANGMKVLFDKTAMNNYFSAFKRNLRDVKKWTKDLDLDKMAKNITSELSKVAEQYQAMVIDPEDVTFDKSVFDKLRESIKKYLEHGGKLESIDLSKILDFSFNDVDKELADLQKQLDILEKKKEKLNQVDSNIAGTRIKGGKKYDEFGNIVWKNAEYETEYKQILQDIDVINKRMLELSEMDIVDLNAEDFKSLTIVIDNLINGGVDGFKELKGVVDQVEDSVDKAKVSFKDIATIINAIFGMDRNEIGEFIDDGSLDSAKDKFKVIQDIIERISSGNYKVDFSNIISDVDVLKSMLEIMYNRYGTVGQKRIDENVTAFKRANQKPNFDSESIQTDALEKYNDLLKQVREGTLSVEEATERWVNILGYFQSVYEYLLSDIEKFDNLRPNRIDYVDESASPEIYNAQLNKYEELEKVWKEYRDLMKKSNIDFDTMSNAWAEESNNIRNRWDAEINRIKKEAESSSLSGEELIRILKEISVVLEEIRGTLLSVGETDQVQTITDAVKHLEDVLLETKQAANETAIAGEHMEDALLPKDADSLTILRNIGEALLNIRNALGSVDDDNGIPSVIASLRELASALNEIKNGIALNIPGGDAIQQEVDNYIEKTYAAYRKIFENMQAKVDQYGYGPDLINTIAAQGIVNSQYDNDPQAVVDAFKGVSGKKTSTSRDDLYKLVDFLRLANQAIENTTAGIDPLWDELKSVPINRKLDTSTIRSALNDIYGLKKSKSGGSGGLNISGGGGEVTGGEVELAGSNEALETIKQTLLEISGILKGDIPNGFNAFTEELKTTDQTATDLVGTIKEISAVSDTTTATSSAPASVIPKNELADEISDMERLTGAVEEVGKAVKEKKIPPFEEERQVVTEGATLETEALTDVLNTILAIIYAVRDKTDAFEQEGTIVHMIAEQETQDLEQLAKASKIKISVDLDAANQAAIGNLNDAIDNIIRNGQIPIKAKLNLKSFTDAASKILNALKDSGEVVVKGNFDTLSFLDASDKLRQAISSLDPASNSFLESLERILAKGPELENLANILANSSKKIREAGKAIGASSNKSNDSDNKINSLYKEREANLKRINNLEKANATLKVEESKNLGKIQSNNEEINQLAKRNLSIQREIALADGVIEDREQHLVELQREGAEAAERAARARRIDIENRDRTSIENSLNKTDTRLSEALLRNNITEDAKNNLRELQQQLAAFRNEMTSLPIEQVRSRATELFEKANSGLKELSDQTMRLADGTTIDTAVTKINKFINENTAMGGKFKAQFESLRDSIQNLPSGAISEFKELWQQVIRLEGEVARLGKTGKSTFDNLTSRIKQMSTNFVAMYFSFYDLYRYATQLFETIREFDDAMTEMRKVSDESTTSLRAYQKQTFDVASQVGSTALSIQNSTADWMRLGESIDEAAESAKAATVLLNVSEFESIDSATEALVSASQAYKDLDKMEIIDVLNNIGNNFSVSTDQLAEGLQNAAAVLKTQGNDLNQAVALLTAGNAITQDMSKTSSGIRTISLRIAGTEEAKDELKEMGEDVDDFIVQTRSKTQALIKDYTAVASNAYQGVDVLDANGNLRNTYEILLDISKIYQEILDEDKQNGTNRGQALVEYIAGEICLGIWITYFMNTFNCKVNQMLYSTI